jgi:hypothetical protein
MSARAAAGSGTAALDEGAPDHHRGARHEPSDERPQLPRAEREMTGAGIAPVDEGRHAGHDKSGEGDKSKDGQNEDLGDYPVHCAESAPAGERVHGGMD